MAFRTPGFPPVARPYRKALPTPTASAPMARALAMSVPRMTPPSMTISTSLAPAVVGDPDGVKAVVERLDGIVRADHTLEGEVTPPLVGEPLRVLPVEVGAQLLVDEGGHGLRRHVLVDVGVGVDVVHQEVPGPGGPLDGLHDLAHAVVGRDAEAVARVALAVAEPGEVGGERDRVVPVLAGLLEND